MLFSLIACYVIMCLAYYQDWINAYIFLGAFGIGLVVLLIFILRFRNDATKVRRFRWIAILLLLIIVFEFQLLNYEAYTYSASFHTAPVEAFEHSGVHLLVVKTIDIEYIDDRDYILKNIEFDKHLPIDIYEITNAMRYSSKNTQILKSLKMIESDFSATNSTVRQYFGNKPTGIEPFLNRTDLSGDSGGLGLVLSSLIAQKELTNSLLFGVTGAIDVNGNVTAIGMIKEKVMIAEKEGFPFIIVPSENAQEANKVKQAHNFDVKIFDVTHVNEAIRIINELNAVKLSKY